MGDELARVRDARQPGHCWADNEVIAVYGQELGPYGISVYMVFSMVAKNGTGECNITLRQVANLLNISPSRVLKSVDQLISLRLVTQSHKSNGDGKPSTYTLMSVEKMTKEQASKFFGTLTPVRMENRGPVLVESDPVREENRPERDPVRNTNTNNTNNKTDNTSLSDQGSDVLFPDLQTQLDSSSKKKPQSQLRSFEDELRRHTKEPWELEKLPRIWRYYLERTERGAMYAATQKRVLAGLNRLRDAVKMCQGQNGALKAFKLAIDNLTEDEFLSGKNDRNQEYRDWLDHLCKNWETFEKRLRAK